MSTPIIHYRSSKSRSRQRRVTWVDDATVSSIDGAQSRNETSSNLVDSACANNNDNMAPVDENENEDTPRDEHVANLDETTEDRSCLPDFICPTSEDKSKEARMRHWLRTNNFTWANRSVPLL